MASLTTQIVGGPVLVCPSSDLTGAALLHVKLRFPVCALRTTGYQVLGVEVEVESWWVGYTASGFVATLCAQPPPPLAGRAVLAFAKSPTVAFLVPRDSYLQERAQDLRRTLDVADAVRLLGSMPWMGHVGVEEAAAMAFRCRRLALPRGAVALREGAGVCVCVFCVRVRAWL
jgi:hypothetical protein